MNPFRSRLALPLLASAACAACAGSNFQWNEARQIRPGMTESELDALMGSPTDVRKQSYGVAWSWSRLDPYSGDARSVSVVLRDGIVVTSAGVPESFK